MVGRELPHRPPHPGPDRVVARVSDNRPGGRITESRALSLWLPREAELREGIRRTPGAAALHHALGLSLVRRKEYREALASLGRAVELDPDSTRFAYVHAVALHSRRRTDEAVTALEAALERHGRSRDLLLGLASIHRDRGAIEEALELARRLVRLDPEDAAARGFVRRLEGRRLRR